MQAVPQTNETLRKNLYGNITALRLVKLCALVISYSLSSYL